MRMSKPEVYMLCGLTGSGKSTYAAMLVHQGFEKLSLDESMAKKHGRAGIDYDARKYTEYEEAIKEELQQKLTTLLTVKKSVIMDYGFWKKDDRDFHKKLIKDNGGTWRLIYFKTSPKVLKERLSLRNKRTDANAVNITEAMLDAFIAKFEEPAQEGEEIIEAAKE